MCGAQPSFLPSFLLSSSYSFPFPILIHTTYIHPPHTHTGPFLSLAQQAHAPLKEEDDDGNDDDEEEQEQQQQDQPPSSSSSSIPSPKPAKPTTSSSSSNSSGGVPRASMSQRVRSKLRPKAPLLQLPPQTPATPGLTQAKQLLVFSPSWEGGQGEGEGEEQGGELPAAVGGQGPPPGFWVCECVYSDDLCFEMVRYVPR
jgi:hypothetical protein